MELSPDSWLHTTLDFVGTWGSGGTPKRTNNDFYGGNIPWLVIGDLNDDVITSADKSITKLGLDNSSAKLIPIGTILIAMYGSIGKMGITGFECTTNQAIAFCKENERYVDKKFLFFYLRSQKDNLLALGKGGAQQNISQTVLKAYPFLLAPLAEQKEIARHLDNLLAQVETLKARLENIPAILKRFRQSVLTAAVSGKLTEDWRKGNGVKISELSDDWKWGDIPCSWQIKLYPELFESRLGKMLDKNKNTGIPTQYLGNINVRWFSFSLDDLQEILVSEKEKVELSLQQDDVLICEGGEPGRCAIWQNHLRGSIVFQKALHRARPLGSMTSKLLTYNLKNDADKNTLDQLFTGTTIKHLTGKAFKNYPLRVPPLEEQTEIVRRVEQLFAFADKIEEKVNNAQTRVDKLTQSILKKAFQGDLTAEWRSQNPDLISGENSAEALLERIKAEREAMKPAKKTRRKAKA